MSFAVKVLGLLALAATIPAFADIYTPQEAFQDLASERLTFVGRDYPNADLGPGGNYVCVYKNSRVYVRHEGCRPSHTMKLSVFSAKIISRNGGLVELYIERNQDAYTLNDANPRVQNATWKLTSTLTPPIDRELSFRDLIQLERNVWNKIYDTCWISVSPMYPNQMAETKCLRGASDPQGNLETVFHDPMGHGFKEAHDLIITAPRK
jgi:hypothetical protein